MNASNNNWDIRHLREHLQYAIQLEYWTVPFYMSAMYSIKDPTADAYKLIQSVVYQEMLHIQLACNAANAFGAKIDLDHAFISPPYKGKEVPHLMFTKGEIDRDPVDPGQSYRPYSAEIGPLDEARVNAMCLIEYPEDDVNEPPDLKQDATEYSSIGEFYRAVLFGATQHVEDIQANHNQVEIFRNFYRHFPSQTITQPGVAGLNQVMDVINAITDQGEGVRRTDTIPLEYRNTADGFNSNEDHFAKFNQIKNLTEMPECYSGVAHPDKGSAGEEAQKILLRSFERFRRDMVTLFNGTRPRDFGPNMAILGGNILNCWKSGAIPRFS